MLKPKDFHHAAIRVTDVERARNFYMNVLGFRQIQRPSVDRPGAWLSLGNAQVHLIHGPAAREEAVHARSFQAGPGEPDLRLRGGFFFGSKKGALLPFSNPVSTAFCLQALELWQQHEADRWCFDLTQLI